MAATTQKVTVSAEPTNRRLSSAERRAEQTALLSNQQARLKQEAAERRAQRANKEVPDAPAPQRTAGTRRGKAL